MNCQKLQQKIYTVDSRYNAIEGTEEFSRYIESYFKGFLVVGTEEFSRYIKSFTGLALYRESTVTNSDMWLYLSFNPAEFLPTKLKN
jgi:hypothetical protein